MGKIALAQLDMFAAPPVAPAARAPAPVIAAVPTPAALPTLERIRGPRCVAWEKLLASGSPLPPLQIIVNATWTGVVVEDLSHPSLGRKMLHADGKIVDYPDWDKTHFHTVYVAADDARSLHVSHPLIAVRPPGAHCIIFRLAGDGEDAPLTLQMPEGM